MRLRAGPVVSAPYGPSLGAERGYVRHRGLRPGLHGGRDGLAGRDRRSAPDCRAHPPQKSKIKQRAAMIKYVRIRRRAQCAPAVLAAERRWIL